MRRRCRLSRAAQDHTRALLQPHAPRTHPDTCTAATAPPPPPPGVRANGAQTQHLCVSPPSPSPPPPPPSSPQLLLCLGARAQTPRALQQSPRCSPCAHIRRAHGHRAPTGTHPWHGVAHTGHVCPLAAGSPPPATQPWAHGTRRARPPEAARGGANAPRLPPTLSAARDGTPTSPSAPTGAHAPTCSLHPHSDRLHAACCPPSYAHATYTPVHTSSIRAPPIFHLPRAGGARGAQILSPRRALPQQPCTPHPSLSAGETEAQQVRGTKAPASRLFGGEGATPSLPSVTQGGGHGSLPAWTATSLASSRPCRAPCPPCGSPSILHPQTCASAG